MKKFFNFLLCACSVFMLSCTSATVTNNVTEDTLSVDTVDTVITEQPVMTYGVSSARTFAPETLSVAQRDSMINADKLPVYTKWNKSFIKDGESNKPYEYATIFDTQSGIIYTVKFLSDESVYVVQKRKTTK